MIKWVAAAIGYSFLRFPGAILGFMVAGFFEHLHQIPAEVRRSS